MTRTYDLVELKTRSVLTCVVSEHGYDLLYILASFEGANLLSLECDNLCSSRVSVALFADEQRRFMSVLQSIIYGHRSLEDLKILSKHIKHINLPGCDEYLF